MMQLLEWLAGFTISFNIIQLNSALIMVEETRKMITATKNLFYAISAKGIAHFDNPDGAAITFAMSVHSILDHESDSHHAGSDDADGEMNLFMMRCFLGRTEKWN